MTTTAERSDIEKLVEWFSQDDDHLARCDVYAEEECNCGLLEARELAKRVEFDIREFKSSVRFGHYCFEWDGMWVHEGMEAFDACICEGHDKRRESLPTQLSTAEAERDAAREECHRLKTSQEMAWASGFECDQHGNMGATAKLASSVTTKKTCLLCEDDNEIGPSGALLRRLGSPFTLLATEREELTTLRARVEELETRANEFVDAAETHRLQLIVEDYVTEKTKDAYRKAREMLGVATGVIDPDSLEPPPDTGEEG